MAMRSFGLRARLLNTAVARSLMSTNSAFWADKPSCSASSPLEATYSTSTSLSGTLNSECDDGSFTCTGSGGLNDVVVMKKMSNRNAMSTNGVMSIAIPILFLRRDKLLLLASHELQDLVCRLLLEKKKKRRHTTTARQSHDRST